MLASLTLNSEESNHDWLFSQEWDPSLIKFQARENLINFFPNLTNWPTMRRLLLLSSAHWDPYVFEHEEIRAFLGQSERQVTKNHWFWLVWLYEQGVMSFSLYCGAQRVEADVGLILRLDGFPAGFDLNPNIGMNNIKTFLKWGKSDLLPCSHWC